MVNLREEPVIVVPHCCEVEFAVWIGRIAFLPVAMMLPESRVVMGIIVADKPPASRRLPVVEPIVDIAGILGIRNGKCHICRRIVTELVFVI